MERHLWKVPEVSDTGGPAAGLRNYLEQRDVRRCLTAASALCRLRRAADVGCGYGRLTMVLSEFASAVVGFEREPALVAEATRLLPGIAFRSVDTLLALPAPTAGFDFAMTFTVLQHLGDADAKAVVEELKRIASPGSVLLVEETDPSLVSGDPQNPDAGLTVGRPVEAYADWMRPFELALRFPRQIEPGYPRLDVGTYMLFAGGR